MLNDLVAFSEQNAFIPDEELFAALNNDRQKLIGHLEAERKKAQRLTVEKEFKLQNMKEEFLQAESALKIISRERKFFRNVPTFMAITDKPYDQARANYFRCHPLQQTSLQEEIDMLTIEIENFSRRIEKLRGS